MATALKKRANELNFWRFDLKHAQVRDVVTWLNIEEQSGAFPQGFFYAKVMLPNNKKGKKAAGFNATPPLEFRPPKNPFLIGVIIPYKLYNDYLEYVAAKEVRYRIHYPFTSIANCMRSAEAAFRHIR